MTTEHLNRRLVAVLCADVVGYSSMMSRDETGTLDALKRHRADVFEPMVDQYRGRIFKLIGDGTMAEFASVLDAVDCAIEIQRRTHADEGGDEPQIKLRIGINLGDVIVDGDDIYGNGVNIAARLEPLAEPGGICVSATVKENVDGRKGVNFSDGGSVHVKNISRPIRVWNWHPSAGGGDTRDAPEPLQQSPGEGAANRNASIAVLPFENMSGDAEQEYFSDGISEDIITDLSKVSGLLVIARNSTFVYKGKSVDLRQVGRELGVTTVLEGSVRRAGNRVRVTAQLIDASTGGHIWAERYDRDLTDIFAVQDEVTLSIVDALKVKLKGEEQKLITEGGTSDTIAHDNYLRATSLIFTPDLNAEVYQKVMDYAHRALDHDPNYAKAHAIIAFADLFDAQNFWTADAATAPARAAERSRKAISLDPKEPLAHIALAFAMQYEGDLTVSNRAAERAIELDPNSSRGYLARGSTAIFDARPADAIPDLEKALRIDPGFTHQFLHFLGLAHYFLGNYETALLMFRERLLLSKRTDSGRVMLAATLGQLGELDEARAVWDELRQRFPDFSVARRLAVQPYRDPAYPKKIYEGLALAGIDPD